MISFFLIRVSFFFFIIFDLINRGFIYVFRFFECDYVIWLGKRDYDVKKKKKLLGIGRF